MYYSFWYIYEFEICKKLEKSNKIKSRMHLDLVEEDVYVLNTRVLYHISWYVVIARVETMFFGAVWNLMWA